MDYNAGIEGSKLMDFKLKALTSLITVSLVAAAYANEGDITPNSATTGPVAITSADVSVTSSAEESVLYELDASASQNAVSFRWRVAEGKGVFWLQEKPGGGWRTEVNQAKATALVPANHIGIAVYEVSVTDKDGNTDTRQVTMTAISPLYSSVEENPAKPTEFPDWGEENTYMAGDKVTFAGIKYIATKWTQSTPANGAGWKFADPEQLREWNKSMSYSRKDKVSWQGKAWKAAYWTQGNTPGEHSVWLEL
ncbi:MAG: hypothetical protein QM578_21930 [Pantoea sp.]|uniref:carbohydrate-binding protein n=1 Tax=Pantoea sp. TaxID=69393 RepID=UPI0039E2DCBD